MGLSLSSILLVYTGMSVTKSFITSATFGAMSIYGYTTKESSKLGSFLLFLFSFNCYIYEIFNDVFCIQY